MTRITLPDDVLRRLGALTEPVLICDRSGRPIGTLQPDVPAGTDARGFPRPSEGKPGVPLNPDGTVDVTRYEGRESPITEEELDRREQLPSRGRPLSDILADLRKSDTPLRKAG